MRTRWGQLQKLKLSPGSAQDLRGGPGGPAPRASLTLDQLCEPGKALPPHSGSPFPHLYNRSLSVAPHHPFSGCHEKHMVCGGTYLSLSGCMVHPQYVQFPLVNSGFCSSRLSDAQQRRLIDLDRF